MATSVSKLNNDSSKIVPGKKHSLTNSLIITRIWDLPAKYSLYYYFLKFISVLQIETHWLMDWLIDVIINLQCKKRFCWVDSLGCFETNCLLITRFLPLIVFDRDPQRSTAENWLGSWNNSAVKHIKEHFFPSIPHLNIYNLPKILNLVYNMHDKESCITENIKLSLAIASDFRVQPHT